jgi:hypothetical protein
MSDLFTDKIKLAIRSCQFHIQGIIPYHLLEEISVSLFNLQTKGILIELIILMDNELKSIKTTNILLRISAAGGQIFTILNLENEITFFINFDKKIKISSTENKYESVTNIQTTITEGILLYQTLKTSAIPIIHLSGCPEISFYASEEWVKTGDKINITWEVDQAQSILLLPQNISLSQKGSMSIQINMDCLLTIQAKNENITAEKRIFIKALTRLGLSFTVQILPAKLNNYIPLEPHPEIPFNYAIPPDCDVRLFWEADTMGILAENDWGEIPVIGYRDIQFKKDASLQFTWKTIFELKKITLSFYILPEASSIEVPKKEKSKNSIFSFLKKRP